jgi:hypothetical protein
MRHKRIPIISRFLKWLKNKVLRKRYLLSFFFWTFVLTSLAKSTDPAYIKKFSKKFSVKSTVETNKFQYRLTPLNVPGFSEKELKKARINCLPYVPFTTSLSISLFGLVSLSHTFQFTDTYFNKGKREETVFRNYELSYYGKRVCLETYYQDYRKLYYNSGPESRVASSTLDPDLKYFQFGMRTFFIFNASHYSYNAAFNQSQFQIKPAGSFMLLTSFDYNQLKGNETFVGRSIDPTASVATYSNLLGLNRNSQLNFNLLPGYGYTLVYKSIYLALAQYVGIGLQFQNYKVLDNSNTHLAVCMASRSKAALGVNGKKVYGGIYLNSDINRSNTPTRFSTLQNIYNMGLFLGFRIIKEKEKK